MSEFVHEAGLPVVMVPFDGGSEAQEPPQVLWDLTQCTHPVTQEEHYLQVNREFQTKCTYTTDHTVTQQEHNFLE